MRSIKTHWFYTTFNIVAWVVGVVMIAITILAAITHHHFALLPN